jgi:hypothetical protein
MRWSCLIAVFGITLTSVVSFAQGPPGDQVSSASVEDAGFFETSGVARFQLIQGRLCLDAPRHRKGSQNRDHAGVYESVTVTAERGIPSLHYVFQSDQQHVTLSVQQAYVVRIESWFPATAERCVLEQPQYGEVSWTVSRGPLEHQHTGSTLLHIRHADHSTFDAHYGRLITRLLRGQSLQMLSDASQLLLFSKLGTSDLPTAAEIEACVAELTSNRSGTRKRAERQLLMWGSPVIPTLQSFAADDLDAEQSQRIRCILNRLRPRVDDTPATLAKLLVNDRDYWGTIAGSLSADQVRLANRHLEQFGSQLLSVDNETTTRIATNNETPVVR